VRRPTSGTRTPVAISKYLLPREVEVVAVRQHPAVLIIPCTQALGGLVLGLIWTAALPHNMPQLIAIWTAASLLLVHGIRSLARWPLDYFVITSERILVISGRSVSMMPLDRLTDMTLERTRAGRLLGYGTFVNGPGRLPQVIKDFLPYPEQLYLLLCGMLFPSSATDAHDDES
jgi:hypothetical protein